MIDFWTIYVLIGALFGAMPLMFRETWDRMYLRDDGNNHHLILIAAILWMILAAFAWPAIVISLLVSD